MADNPFLGIEDDQRDPSRSGSPLFPSARPLSGNPFVGLDDGVSPASTRPAVLRAEQHAPEEYADAERLGASVGMPAEVLARNPKEAKRIALEQQLTQVQRTNPALAEWLLDGTNLTLAKDDVPTLTSLSRAMQSAGDVAGQVPSEFNRFFGRGISGLGDLNDAAGRMIDRGVRRVPFVGESISNFLRTPIPAWASPSVWARGTGGTIEENFTVQLPEERRNLATDVAGGIGQLIGQGVVTYANPASAVALNLGVGADQAADMAREEVAEGTAGADAAVLASAPVAAALEKLGLSKLLERAPPGVKNKVLRYVTDKVVAAGIEGTQEAAEQVAYNAVAELAYNPDQSLTEGLGENFTVGAAVGAAARVLVGARFARTRTEREAETLDAMEAAAGASLLRTRDPARFAAMVRQLAASGADTVFVDAEQAQTYFQSASLDPTSLGIDAEALSEAVALGGDLAIPMETWLTTIAPDHGAALREFRRIGQASLAPGEVAGEEIELDEAAERFLASVEEGGTTDSRVFDDVLGQLLGTDMDRATAEKNATLMQSVFRSLAARSGRDAWSLYEQYGLRIVRERPEATAILRRVPNIDATIDSMLDRLAAGDIPTEADVFGPTISEFLSAAGIRPAENEPLSGEIARLAEDDRFTRKGRQRLVRPDDPAALTLDYAREAAVEAGFLPEGADINDLLDALGADRRMDVPQDQALADLRSALLELDEEVSRLGLDPVQDRDEVKRRLFPAGEMDQSEPPEFSGLLAKLQAHKEKTGGKDPFEERLAKQRELEGLRAAMRDPLTGKIYTGHSHQAAINSAPKWRPGMADDDPARGVWGRLSNEWNDETENAGFVDRDGNFISRDEAEKRWNVLTMEDVRDARKRTFFQSGVASNAREVSSFDYAPKVGEGKIDTTISDAHVTSGGWVRGFGPAGTLKMVIEARLGRNKAGRVQLDYDPDEGRVTASGLEVSAEARRKGVASAMFDAAFMANPLSDIGHHGTTGDGTEFATAYGEGRVNGKRVFLRPDRLRRGSGVALGAAGGAIDEATGLPLNPDGTVTVYHHTNADAAAAIERTGRLKSAGEPDVYVTTRRETDTGYGDTAVAIRVKPELLHLDDEFPDGRRDFRVDTGRPGGSIAVKVDVGGEFSQSVDQTQTPEFKRWANDAPVVEPDELWSQYEGGPAVFRLFHGTTADFDVFDRDRANPESDFGAGFYFSNTSDDVASNYAGLGPDLTNKIELRAEELASGYEYDDDVRARVDAYAEEHGIDINGSDEAVKSLARDEFVQHEGATMPVFVRVLNPAIVGGPNETNLTFEQPYDEETDEYGEPTGTLLDFVEALRQVASRYDDGEVEPAIEEIMGEAYDGGMSLSDAIAKLKESEQFGYYTDDNGKLVSSEIIRQALERAGFDGIVDYSVDQKFGSQRRIGQAMQGMSEDTVHVIAFEPTQIKSAIGNQGSFDPNNESILFQSGDPTQTAAFKRWFGESKVVDANGEPLVVYHTSTFGDIEVFDKAEQMKGMAGYGFYFSDKDGSNIYAEHSHKFKADRDFRGNPKRTNIVPAYLKIENPLRADNIAEISQRFGKQDPGAFGQGRAYAGLSPDAKTAIQRAGYDGVIATEYVKRMRDGSLKVVEPGEKGAVPHPVYAVFEPEQIKSATGNRGTFDPNDPSILNQDGDPTTEAIRRGYIKFTSDRKFTIGLTENADLSTFLHESAHFFLEVMGDLASDSANAPQGIVDDYMAILRWLGAPRREEIGVEQHEQFARGFEAYLGEGKPPTPELAGAFARFRAWMKAIYKTLTALDVSLTDEVRGVFDRLVAGDEAIRRAEEAVNVEPLFKEAARAGMSEARFREYLRLQQAGHDEAEARLTAQAMKEVKRETEAWWREESARVREEVAAEVYAEPVYRAWAALARNQQPDGTALDTPPVKLDKGWLLDKYGQEFLNKNLLHKNVYAVEGGISGDIAAGLFGFRTGDELVTALANAAPMKAWIKAETDSRMRERHGDMRLDGSLPEKAMAAVHNSKRMKAIAADIALLEGLAGEPAMNPAALRQWAEARIARTPIRKLTPYAFLRSERKHAREAVKAAAAGKWSEALVAQRRRLAHAHLYDVAVKAQEQAEKRTRWLARQNRATTQERLAKAGPGYREQVNAILAAVGLRQPEQGERGALRAFLDQLQEAGDETAVADAVIALVDGGKPAELRDLTVADFRAVYDAVRNLAHLAGQRNRLVAAADKIAFDEAVTAMVDRAAEVNPDRLPEELSRRDLSLTDRAVDRVRRFASELDRPENIIEALDGGEAGPWHDYFWQALNRAEDTAIGLRRRVGAQLKALRESMPDDFMASLDARVDLPFGANVSRGTLLGMVLNTGNAGNLQRLRDGGIFVNGAPVRLTDAQVVELRELLTADELRYVQGLWDAVNSLWPDITALQKAMSGIAPEKVEAQAFEVGGVTYRGGYWPLAYDHSKSNAGERQSDDDALRIMMASGYTRATTPKGYTKQRVEEMSAPLDLDFGSVMSRHLDHVMTDIAYRAAVKDTVRILRSTRIKAAIITRLGKGAYDTLKSTVAYAVSANDAAQAAVTMRRMVSTVVSNSAVSALAIRPEIMLGNLASQPIQALDRVGARSLMRGFWALNTGRSDLTAEITSLSPFMAERLGETDYHYQQELRKAQGKQGYGPAYKRIMMTLHRWADHDVTRAAWWGRYQEALAAGETRGEAVRLADKAIRQTQTANARKDLSIAERDPAFRESRIFMGPMFVILGRLRAAGKGEGATRTVGLRAASLLRQMFFAPALFMLAAGRWPEDGGDDDDDIGAGEWALWLATNTLLFPLQAMPILREIAGSVEAWATDRPINPRAAPTTQAAAGLVKASKSIADNIDDYQDTGELDWLEMTRDLTSAVGPFTGLPAGQTRITTRTIEAIADDPDANAMEMTRMAVYGPPKH